jgi:hypothetical protein
MVVFVVMAWLGSLMAMPHDRGQARMGAGRPDVTGGLYGCNRIRGIVP